MEKPLISVVTVCFNAISSINETVNSVLSQTYPKIEYIIIDGGSTDGTVNYLNSIVGKLASFVSEPDKGIYDAMNKGVAMANGEWIIFMNSGDTFVNNKILNQVSVFMEDETVDVLFGDTIFKSPWGKYIITGNFFDKKDAHLPFCHQSSFVRTALMKKFPFDISYKVAADYKFFFHLYKMNRRFLHINIPIAVYDSIGFSTNRVIDTYKEVSVANGSSHSITYLLRLLYFYLRHIIMLLFPCSIIYKYRMWKYRKIECKHSI